MLGSAYFADYAYYSFLPYLLSLLRLPCLPSLLCLQCLLWLLSLLCRPGATGSISGSFPQNIACSPYAKNVPPKQGLCSPKKVAGPISRAGISRLCPPSPHTTAWDPQKWVKFLSRTKKQVKSRKITYKPKILRQRHFFCVCFGL